MAALGKTFILIGKAVPIPFHPAPAFLSLRKWSIPAIIPYEGRDIEQNGSINPLASSLIFPLRLQIFENKIQKQYLNYG